MNKIKLIKNINNKINKFNIRNNFNNKINLKYSYKDEIYNIEIYNNYMKINIYIKNYNKNKINLITKIYKNNNAYREYKNINYKDLFNYINL